jgi:6-phosphofructokinase 1
MGRDAGWIALTAGVAGNAHVVLVPEKPIDLDHVCALLKYNHDHGKKYGIVVVAEGAKLPSGEQATQGTKVDAFGHARLSGIAAALAEEIEKKTGYETRSVNLGHTQRGGSPSAYDRMLATRYGLAAIEMVHKGEFGRLVVLHGTKIESIPLAEAISKNRTLDESFLSILDSLEPKV